MNQNQQGFSIIKIINIILTICIIVFAFFIYIYVSDDKEEKPDIKIVELKTLSKENTMFKNELPKKIEKPKLFIEDKEVKILDPDLDYAIKLFESDLNTKIKKVFIKPFNYIEGSNCKIQINLITNKYIFKSCNSDSIYKRELQIATDKMFPIKRFTYNNINLKKQKRLIISLNMD